MKTTYFVRFCFGLTFMLLAVPMLSQTVINMQRQNGVFLIPCTVNGIALNFILDTGASEVSISVAEALFMAKNGYLSEDDFIGTALHTIANGDIVEGTSIILRKIQIGNIVLRDVEASIVHSLEAPLLLGQSAIQKLGKIEIDYQKNQLIIKKGSTQPNQPTTSTQFGNNSSNVRTAIDYSRTIKQFLTAENNRNFNQISSYYAPIINRYYNKQYIDHTALQKLYEGSWRVSSYSSNEVLAIDQIDGYTYNVSLSFTFYHIKQQQEKTVTSLVRFIFDNNGKIIETYSLK